MNITHDSKLRRQRRVRAKLLISGHPRVSVFRSSKYLYAQVIDDSKAKTIASVSTMVKDDKEKATKSEKAKKAGVSLAKKLLDLKVKQVVLDRGPYKYGGRVAAFTEGLREGGVNI